MGHHVSLLWGSSDPRPHVMTIDQPPVAPRRQPLKESRPGTGDLNHQCTVAIRQFVGGSLARHRAIWAVQSPGAASAKGEITCGPVL